MSATWAYVGGACLALATLPQAWALVRDRRASEFGWLFAGLNVLGLALFTWRSWDLGEWAFLAVNALTTAFWTLVLVVKATTGRRARPRAPAT